MAASTELFKGSTLAVAGARTVVFLAGTRFFVVLLLAFLPLVSFFFFDVFGDFLLFFTAAAHNKRENIKTFTLYTNHTNQAHLTTTFTFRLRNGGSGGSPPERSIHNNIGHLGFGGLFGPGLELRSGSNMGCNR